MNHLRDKVGLVTGAGRGIGRGIARALAAAGAAVVVNDLGASVDGDGKAVSPAQQVADEITAAGERAVANSGNVADYTQAGEMIQQALDAFGRLDIVVHVADLLRDRMIFNMTESEWDAVIAEHLKGAFNVCSHASKHFRQVKRGRIILMSSSSAFGSPGQPNYAAAEAGILGLTWSCANALRQYDVTANAVLPAAGTRMIDATPYGKQASQQTGKLPSDAARGTEADPENVAPLVVYLASDEAAKISGQCLASIGYGVYLISQPKIIKTIRAENGWNVDELARIVPRTLGAGLAQPRASGDLTIDEIGLITHHNDLPDSAWVQIAPHIRFWSIPVPPYGETR